MNILLPSDIIQVKEKIITECGDSRRGNEKSNGSLKEYSTTYVEEEIPIPNKQQPVMEEQLNSILTPLNQINKNITAKLIDPNIVIEEDLLSLDSSIALLKNTPIDSSNNDCNDNCSGLCVTECYSGCSGCSGTCSGGCSTTCSGSCSGSCSGTCSGCVSGCTSNCMDTCNYGCGDGCKGGCGNNCKSSCALGCSYSCSAETCGGQCNGIGSIG